MESLGVLDLHQEAVLAYTCASTGYIHYIANSRTGSHASRHKLEATAGKQPPSLVAGETLRACVDHRAGLVVGLPRRGSRMAERRADQRPERTS